MVTAVHVFACRSIHVITGGRTPGGGGGHPISVCTLTDSKLFFSVAVRCAGAGAGAGGHRESGFFVIPLPEPGPGCRAMVPYTASPSRPSPSTRQQQRRQQGSSMTAIPPPKLLALPPSVRGGYSFRSPASPCYSSSSPSPSSPSSSSPSSSSPSSSSSSSRRFFFGPCSSGRAQKNGGSLAALASGGGSVARRVEIPLEVFPIVFQVRFLFTYIRHCLFVAGYGLSSTRYHRITGAPWTGFRKHYLRQGDLI